ncbi:MAG: alanine racemase, partial [Aeriscardovia sp.]|nr:alanine racemase [Aeriscardovia sp.]
MAYMDNKDLTNTEISERREKEIGEAVSKVMEAVDAAAKGRPVRVIAATKTRDVGEVMAAIRGGIKVIGENRVQELEEKMPIISAECQKAGISISAHLIGQLQKNKIAKVLPLVDCIESVESFDKAQEISERVPGGKLLDIYLEVN